MKLSFEKEKTVLIIVAFVCTFFNSGFVAYAKSDRRFSIKNQYSIFEEIDDESDSTVVVGDEDLEESTTGQHTDDDSKIDGVEDTVVNDNTQDKFLLLDTGNGIEFKAEDKEDEVAESKGTQVGEQSKINGKNVIDSPIDISYGIFDSIDLIMKSNDDFNIENDYFNVKLGFNYTSYLRNGEKDDFNKYIFLNPKFLGVDNIYFSVFNYHNLFRNKYINREDFRKNYYTMYTKINVDELNDVNVGASFGYIPFNKNINQTKNNKAGNFKKYTLFSSLNTKFDLELFNNDVSLNNLLAFDFNLLKSNYKVNKKRSNSYIKVKDAVLLNYDIDGFLNLFTGIDFSLYNRNKHFRKSVGLSKTFECNFVTGVKFDYGSFNISIGNRGIGLGLNVIY